LFTGLIQSLGKLKLANHHRLQVTCPGSPILEGLAIGDSIAVDGACLTVETILSGGFMVAVSAETLQRTTLSQQAESGDWVNLEPALRVGDKLGGHFVSGHIDGVGEVQQLTQTDESWEISFFAPAAVAQYLVSKGSIAVNGISLTVSACNPEGTWFEVAVIPHSFAETNLQFLQPGDRVNLEADLLGKYAAKLLQPSLNHTRSYSDSRIPTITEDFLAEHGFV
jgi:riboflavin synthase